MTGQLSYLASPHLERPLMVVGWRNDAGDLGRRVTSYLVETIGLEVLADIEPDGFFPMTSVEVTNDLVSFPSSRFNYSEKSSLITLYSDIPTYETPEFLKLILDVAARYSVGQIVMVNGLPMMTSHNTPNQIMANLSTPLLRDWLSGDGVNTDINYESPPGQKPPISAYLTWEARKRGIEAVSLWVPVPFYLAPFVDQGATRRVLAFLGKKLALPLELETAVEAENAQRTKLGVLRGMSAEVEKSLTMLESNLSLTEYEIGQLAMAVRESLSQSDSK